jgi:opacity protein-like surface antigen
MKIRVIAIVLASLLACSTGARAQVPRFWHVGFAGGMSLPLSDAKDALKNGFHGQGFFGVDVPHLPLGVRAALDYERFDLKGLGSGSSGTGTLMGGMANGLWHFPAGPVKPYISAGLGGFNVKSEVDSSGATTSESKIHLAVNAGAGVELKLGSIAGFVEARYQNIFTEKGLSPGLASASKIRTQLIPISVGLIF